MTPTELEQQLRDHERRLAAIELEQAGQTAIIRDLASCMEDYERAEARITAATPPATVEASAVSEWPRYYRHKQDRGGYVRYESANEPGRIVRFDGGPAAPWTWTYQQAIEFCLDGTWHEVPAAEAEARIAAARGEKQNCNGCGKPLLPENAWMTDGCPCNSPKGCNSPELDQKDAAEKLRNVIMAVSEYTSSPPHRRDDHSCLLCRMLESPDYKTYRGSPVLEAEARIAAAKGEWPPSIPAIPDDESGEPEGCESVACRYPSVIYGEASAVSEWPRYVQINENRIARFDDATSPSKNFDLVPIIGCTWDSQTPDEYIGRGQWKLISRAEAEARITAARKEKPRLDDAFPIPPTAERESEPTPVAQCIKDAGKKICQLYTEQCDGKEFPYLRAADIINRHVGPELATLRAENERLTKAKCGADGYIDLLQSDREKLRQQLTAKDVEIERQRKIINDNFASTAERVAELEQQLATSRAAAEAMDAIGKFNYIQLSKRPRGDWQAQFGSGQPGYGPTPTAAILAAKAASGTTKGGE